MTIVQYDSKLRHVHHVRWPPSGRVCYSLRDLPRLPSSHGFVALEAGFLVYLRVGVYLTIGFDFACGWLLRTECPGAGGTVLYGAVRRRLADVAAPAVG